MKYSEQIVSLLNKAGYLQTARGNNGGYKLNRNPNEYKIGDILRASEGDLAPIGCLEDETNSCDRKDKCITLPFWEGLDKVINDYVDSKTLADII
jgi:Rrf2 family protein